MAVDAAPEPVAAVERVAVVPMGHEPAPEPQIPIQTAPEPIPEPVRPELTYEPIIQPTQPLARKGRPKVQPTPQPAIAAEDDDRGRTAVSTLQEQAEAMLLDIDGAEDQKKYERLAPEDRALIFQLAARDVEQAAIARIVGCHPSTVSRALKLIDTRQGARMILNSKAARLAQVVSDTKDEEVARKVLTQLDVLPDKGSGGTPQFGVFVGIQQSDEDRRKLLSAVVIAQIASNDGEPPQ